MNNIGLEKGSKSHKNSKHLAKEGIENAKKKNMERKEKTFEEEKKIQL